MPDTPLSQCIEREREAGSAWRLHKCKETFAAHEAARAATDEAVRKVEARIAELERDRLALAKLAANEPQFFNPLAAFAAQKLRDDVLARDAMAGASDGR